jgi:hypothetical protein
MLVWLPVGFSGLGVAIALIAFFASRSTRKLDAEQLAELKRAQQKDADEKDERRRREDDERAGRLRAELQALSVISNERFTQWQDAVRDLDELWSFVEDEVLPWQRRAYRELREFGSEIAAPPQLARRHHAHD